jgi:ketosteroid isomerase-like protein
MAQDALPRRAETQRKLSMQRTLIIMAIAIMFSALAAGQTGSKKASTSAKLEQELMQMERDWSAAYLNHEVAVVDRILADDYIGTDGRGVMTNKAQEIEDARSTDANRKILSELIDDMKVRLYDDTAIVNGRSTEKIEVNGKELTIQYRRTDVFVKRGGRWQCVSFHGSRIIAPPK